MADEATPAERAKAASEEVEAVLKKYRCRVDVQPFVRLGDDGRVLVDARWGVFADA